MAAARKALVRTEGEDRMMRIAERALDTEANRARLRLESSVAQRSLAGFARSVDVLTGSKRMSACASLLQF
jgi:hypothetical protein